MPTQVTDLGNPTINLLYAFWKAVSEDLRGEAPIFGQVSSRHRRLSTAERATIEKEAARLRAVKFVNSLYFGRWIRLTADVLDQPFDSDEFRRALYAGHFRLR